MKHQVRKICSLFAAVCAAITMSSCGAADNDNSGQDGEASIRLLLSFVHDMQNVPYYWTVDNGWDKQCGFNLDIKTAEGVENPLQLLLAGEVDVALIDPLSYIFARDKGLPVMAIGEDVARTPVAYVSEASKNIKAPEDLPGHIVGVQPGGDSEWYLEEIMRKTLSESDISSVKIVSTGYSMKPLVTGQLDVYSMWPTNTDISTLIAKGDKFNIMRAYEYGIETMGNLIVVDERELKKNRDLFVRFLATTVTGLQQSLDPSNLDEAISATQTRLEREVPKEVYENVYEELHKVRSGPAWEENGAGWNDAVAYEKAIEIVKQQGEIDENAQFEDLYTNDLLKEVMSDGSPKPLSEVCG